MRGGPIDLTPFGAVLTGIGIAYWLLMLGGIGLALWLPRRWWAKFVASALIGVLFIYPVAQRAGTERQQVDAAQARLNQAMALFEERCKGAGERIHRTVDNVEGVVWLKWREPYSNADNFADQFKLNDPYGRECGSEDCIAAVLHVSAGGEKKPEEAMRRQKGYRFVETTDPRDGKIYRYTAVIKVVYTRTPDEIAQYKRNQHVDPGPDVFGLSLEREPIERYTARYDITWDDISTREDREHWIAGGSLKVVDLQSNEVIAERIGYMVDRGQGSQEGSRSPWLFAKDTACPAFVDPQGKPTRIGFIARFVQQAVTPTAGEKQQ